jgi:hypothetical protein
MKETIDKNPSIEKIQDALLRGAESVEVSAISLSIMCKITEREMYNNDGNKLFDLIDKRLRQHGMYIAGAGGPIPGNDDDMSIKIAKLR